MPYARPNTRRSMRTLRPRYTDTRGRVTATKSKQAKARANAVAKARKAPVKQVVKNALAIRRLNTFQWGPMQKSLSVAWNQVPLQNHPLCFHLNNCHVGNKGPHVYRFEGGVVSKGVFSELAQPGYGQMFDDDGLNVPNGPIMNLIGCKLQFQVRADSSVRHVEFHIVRQKKINTQFFRQSDADNFLPNCLGAFRELAGPFAYNRIDKRYFEVIAHRKIYINSKGTVTPADIAAGHQYTAEATTPNKKFLNMYLRFNKVQKQLESSINEENNSDNLTHDATGEHGNVNIDVASNWSYDNIHPLANMFCIISTDDNQNYASVITGDAVKVDIIRSMFWRDKIM